MHWIKLGSEKAPLLFWLIAQVLSVMAIFLLRQLNFRLEPFWYLLIHCLLSSALSLFLFRLPRWWGLISILIPLLFVISNTSLQLPTWIYFALFTMLALFFSHTLKERVPLYLSNRVTHEALNEFMHKHHLKSAIDLGCGFGGVVRALASDEKNATGVETAPMAWLVAWMLSRLNHKGTILRHNIWDTPLKTYDLVYTFLSPVPMEKIYRKAQAELKSGSYLISNSFPVPDVNPTEVWELNDQRKTQLFIYKF